MNRTHLAAAAATLLAFLVAPAAQAGTRHGATLSLAPSALRAGGTFAVIATCRERGATPTVSSPLLPSTIQLDGRAGVPFALLDVARGTRPDRYRFTLRCLSGRRVRGATAVLTVLG